ncbi:MAG TPA: MdtA/MuxA family multidrug efflux RND transporter periplasmic adaptor subunit [Bradyrhizobium sp.]|uniref:MdtA/MuxA family multidrug efflux RND transporter periplasmic adaptor subunit n=1 Tax=Bradyrhizobium sp. TaxID=376 RepID=UPI002B9871A6|nr:MdtA/MuxA family multidrug efflux RND transporter periplasmic adaptor subunit [Bradyrhizobium sp.]HLZ05512.1 MdtA/MuxA family multidrug efflux RND transporter periplasmic adaptor subunit [Bradyrhizobium sp.]
MDQPLKPPAKVPSYDRSPTKPRSGGRVVVASLIVLSLVAGIVWWTRHQGSPQPNPGGKRGGGAPMSIVPETVGKGDVGINLNALGTVTSLATVTVRTQISGYLIKVVFKEGDEVKKGDLLAEIDPRPYEAALAQQRGQLARDEALLKGAQVDLARYQGLAAQNAVPHQQLDTQTALVAQDQGTVEADRALVKAAEVNLAFTKIVSPIDGRVGLRQIDQGNYVTPGDANGLVVITQIQPISVLFTVPEDNLQAISKRLQSGAQLPVTALDRAGANKLADGVLTTFDSQIDPTTGTIKLRAQFPNDTRTLYPNQFVNVRLLVDTHKDVVTMSTAGIQRGVPGTFVYLVNADSTVSVRPVKLGVTDGDRVEVLSGLEPGDRVVIDGADKLREGAKVIVRAEGDANNAPANAKDGVKGGVNAAGTNGGDKAGGGQKKRSSGGDAKPAESKQSEPKQGEPKQ